MKLELFLFVFDCISMPNMPVYTAILPTDCRRCIRFWRLINICSLFKARNYFMDCKNKWVAVLVKIISVQYLWEIQWNIPFLYMNLFSSIVAIWYVVRLCIDLYKTIILFHYSKLIWLIDTDFYGLSILYGLFKDVHIFTL